MKVAYFKVSKKIYGQLFPIRVVGNNSKHEDCVLSIIGTTAKITTSGSIGLLTMATKIHKVFPSIIGISAGDFQAPKLLEEQPVSFQGSLHEYYDLENQAFQKFEEEIVLHGSNDANMDIASADDFNFDSVLWIKPCLLLGNSLPVTGVIAKLIASGKLITMATKLFVSDSQTSAYAFDLVPHNFHGKWLFVDSIGGEESSAANDCIKLAGHTDLASLQFDPGGYLLGGLAFDPGSSYSHGFVMSTCTLSSRDHLKSTPIVTP